MNLTKISLKPRTRYVVIVHINQLLRNRSILFETLKAWIDRFSLLPVLPMILSFHKTLEPLLTHCHHWTQLRCIIEPTNQTNKQTLMSKAWRFSEFQVGFLRPRQWDNGLCLIFQIMGSIQTFTYPVTWYKVKVKQKID